ncbi:MAG: Crp/Fnr family transcriptional regulator [Nitrospinae bacterium]|nr:Crp/Fnr family transcriptional regulator [Nitrospinota bacterium]
MSIKQKILASTLFSTLSEAEIESIASVTKTRIYPKGAMIIGQEEHGSALFIIAKGSVKVVLFGEDGGETILATLEKGNFFGEMALFGDMQRSATVYTAEETELLVIEKGDLLKLINKFPAISLYFLKELSNRLRNTDERIECITLLDVYHRVIRVILQYAKAKGIYGAEEIVINNRPSNQEIANMIGVSRETVSRVMSSLAKAGSISANGKKLVIRKTPVK